MESEGYEVYNDPEFKRFLAGFARFPFVTEEEERQLGEQLNLGGAARQKATQRLVEAHLRLVVSIAAGYRGWGVSMQDLVQEGTLGLYDAARKFNPERGAFKTYASWWVRQRVQDYLNNHSRTVRLPITVIRKGVKIARQKKQGGPIGDGKLAELIGTNEERMRRIETAMQGEVSLDAPLATDSDTTVGATIVAPDPYAPIDEQIDTTNLVETMHKALATLGPREREILEARFAMNGRDEEETLDELSKRFNVSRERIRQIQVTAMGKLKSGPYGKVMQRFVD